MEEDEDSIWVEFWRRNRKIVGIKGKSRKTINDDLGRGERGQAGVFAGVGENGGLGAGGRETP